MAKSATEQLNKQIEAIRQEAFAAGYASAMQAIREATSKPAPGIAVPKRAVPATRQRKVVPAATEQQARQPRGRPRKSVPATPPKRRPSRGSNAHLIEEILKSIAPGAARPAEIRSTLQSEKGVSLAFTSIRHALGQLETRGVVEQVADSRTWRHLG
jgi:hypothetical protein